MQPRVTAILVCANGAGLLDRTLEALAAQTRPPEALVFVDVGSNDGSTAHLQFGGAAQLARIAHGTPFGAAVAHGARLAQSESIDPDDEWLWILGHDNAPAPDALAHMLQAIEVAPSVVIAGPKLVETGDTSRITAFGESMTHFGRSLSLVHDELDQGQHDTATDVLGVAAGGMLVRRSVWDALGGFDPALPDVDAALDLCVRARLAGHRVSVVPDARVTSAGPVEEFGRAKVSAARRAKAVRQAQLHRRLVYASSAFRWLHWLALVPLAVIRSIGQLVAKRPAFVVGEFAAAFGVAFGGRVGRARNVLARNKQVGWAAIDPLRIDRRRLRERRTTDRDLQVAHAEDSAELRASFVGDGGVWAVLAAALVSAVVFFPLIGASAVSGGGLLPLSSTVSDLWSNVGYGWRGIGAGFTGAADPFAAVLAVLGSVTFWAPSLAVVVVLLLALPLSALGAWFAVRGMTIRTWVPAVGAVLYALSPSLFSGISTGHLGAVIAHILLPWLFLAMVSAQRSVAAASGAAIMFAAVAASAPSLIPLLLVVWVVFLAVGWRHALRRVFIPIPAAILFVPLVLEQIRRGNVLAIFADPGAPSATRAPSAFQLAAGSPLPDWNGWAAVFGSIAGGRSVLPFVVAVLVLPLACCAIGALLGRRWVTAGAVLLVALGGYATAFAATGVTVTAVGSTTTVVWPGAGLSVYWLALAITACIAIDTVPRLNATVSVVSTVLTAAAIAPMAVALYTGAATISSTSGSTLSAYVDAEAQADPDVGTLVISPERDGSISVDLQRGSGSTLDDQSTLDSTARTLTASKKRLATLAGNLISRSGYDPRSDLRTLGVNFVLLQDSPSSETAHAVYARADGSIGQNSLFTNIGDTSTGELFHYTGKVDPPASGSVGTSFAHVVSIVVLAVVFGIAALLAVPTAPRRRTTRRSRIEADEPATTFDEERE